MDKETTQMTIIKSLIADERGAIEKYTKLTISSKSPIISAMFKKIAEDEMHHLQMLEEYEKIIEQKSCLEIKEN